MQADKAIQILCVVGIRTVQCSACSVVLCSVCALVHVWSWISMFDQKSSFPSVVTSVQQKKRTGWLTDIIWRPAEQCMVSAECMCLIQTYLGILCTLRTVQVGQCITTCILGDLWRLTMSPVVASACILSPRTIVKLHEGWPGQVRVFVIGFVCPLEFTLAIIIIGCITLLENWENFV